MDLMSGKTREVQLCARPHRPTVAGQTQTACPGIVHRPPLFFWRAPCTSLSCHTHVTERVTERATAASGWHEPLQGQPTRFNPPIAFAGMCRAAGEERLLCSCCTLYNGQTVIAPKGDSIRKHMRTARHLKADAAFPLGHPSHLQEYAWVSERPLGA